MKKFLLRTTVFLALALCVYLALLAGVMALNHRAIDSCRLEVGVDSVILGDSHPAWAIDDSGIQGLRNISLNAEGYKYTYAKLQHLLDTNPGVRRIYLGFSFHNLSSYFDEYVTGPTFRLFASRYLAVLGPSDILQVVKSSPRHAPDLLTGLLRDGLASGLRGECRLYGRFSQEPMRGQFNRETMERRITEQYYDDQARVRGISEQNLHYLEKIVELGRSHGAELVVLNTPLHPAYASRVPQFFRDQYQHFIDRQQLEVFDFAGLELSDADFLPDGDHTNHQGAMRASRHFAEYHSRSLQGEGDSR